MNLINKQFKTSDNNIINYYEIDNGNPTLLIIHAQGTNASSYSKVIKDLSKKFHIILVDCYGHGKSSHNREKYNIVSQGNDLIEFIKATTKGNITVLGHSSGGLIACYIASNYNCCVNLILEDAPLFPSNGEKRFNCYNYKDLSTVCHNYINQDKENDFVYFDPPYVPLTDTSNFTAYTSNGFGYDEQVLLRDTFIELDNRGCYVMLSNSDADLVHDLYKDYQDTTIRVDANRMINSNAKKRGAVKEVLIKNY